MAPERLEGRPASPATDLFGLGATLYEALAGRPPFAGPTPLAVIAAMQRGDRPSLAAQRPDAHPRLVAVVERAIAADPSDRYPSAGVMLEALDRGPSVPTRVAPTTVSPTRVIDGPVRSRRGRSWRALAVVALVVVLMGGGLLWQATRGGDDPPPALSTTTTTTTITPASSLPPSLDDALRDLEEAVSR
jgi:serine/threonine-protein kinase